MPGDRPRAALMEHAFPALADWGYEITSEITPEYNCIAWAAGDDTRVWWPSPDDDGSSHWPAGVPRETSVEAFAAAYGTLGYVRCEDGELEAGFEKIAIFATDSGEPTHAARQLDTRGWTSKVGRLQDIRHPLQAFEGTEYGHVALFMKRPARATR